jgi:hypothetical protein
VWRPELTGAVFPIYSSDDVAPGSCPAGPPLNPALLISYSLQCPVTTAPYVIKRVIMDTWGGGG